jgi:hypothetical protein
MFSMPWEADWLDELDWFDDEDVGGDCEVFAVGCCARAKTPSTINAVRPTAAIDKRPKVLATDSRIELGFMTFALLHIIRSNEGSISVRCRDVAIREG